MFYSSILLKCEYYASSDTNNAQYIYQVLYSHVGTLSGGVGRIAAVAAMATYFFVANSQVVAMYV